MTGAFVPPSRALSLRTAHFTTHVLPNIARFLRLSPPVALCHHLRVNITRKRKSLTFLCAAIVTPVHHQRFLTAAEQMPEQFVPAGEREVWAPKFYARYQIDLRGFHRARVWD
jgi:hypothetical protein